MERISWDQYFMSQSHLLALRSTCERYQLERQSYVKNV